MKIGINSLPLSSGHATRGIGFYTKYLIEYLKKQPDLDIVEFGDLSKLEDVDVVHFPFFDLYQRSMPLKSKWPMVVTIHDVIPLKFSQHYPAGIKGKLNLEWQKMALKGVDAVITDSAASKKDIIEILKVKSEKIHSIYLAPAEHFKIIKDDNKLKKTKEKFNLPEKYALFVGSVNWNKNILNITKACIDANVDLVLIGKSFLTKDNLDHPELKSFKLFLEKYSHHPLVHILGFVEDEDLVNIVNLAQVMMLPSIAEGFGFPILEAQACGTAVITSNTSSMSEIAGKGALLVDPNSVEEMTKAVIRLVSDKNLNQQLVKEGLNNVKNYSWEKTAAQTAEVYRQLLKTN